MSGELAAVAVAMMLGSSAVHADGSADDVAGSACEAVNGNYASQVTTSVGAVGNRSTTGTLQVNCPMVTDLFNFNKLNVQVSVQKGTAASMSCAVVTRSWDNTSGTVNSLAISGAGHQDYGFYDVPHWVFSTVRCTIPNATTTNSATRSWVNGYSYHLSN